MATDQCTVLVSGETPVEYRDCPGHPGYRVGSDGSVWSCWVRTKGASRPAVLSDIWHRLKPYRASKLGHLRVSLNGKTPHRVHRLVLEAFVGPCPDGMQGCHFDGNPTNNHINNLRWDSHAGNLRDTIRHGRTARGEKNPNARITAEIVRCIRADHAALKGTKSTLPRGSVTTLARRYGLSRGTIYEIVSHGRWSHVE